VRDIFQQFANVLTFPHWSAYVLDDQYTNLISGVGKKRKLLAFAHLKPSMLDGFASAKTLADPKGFAFGVAVRCLHARFFNELAPGQRRPGDWFAISVLA
jgi:hypothetical protein